MAMPINNYYDFTTDYFYAQIITTAQEVVFLWIIKTNIVSMLGNRFAGNRGDRGKLRRSSSHLVLWYRRL